MAADKSLAKYHLTIVYSQGYSSVEKENNSDFMKLHISVPHAVIPENVGLFVSRGKGQHPDRVIQSYELIYVSSGTLHIQEAGQRYTIQAGNTLLLYPGLLHGGTANYDPGLKFYWLHFRLADSAQGTAHSIERFEVPKHTTVGSPDRLVELFRWFHDEQEAGTLNPVTAILVTIMMLSVVSLGATEEKPSRIQAHLVEHAHQLIRTKYATDITTAVVAKHLGCNADYLGRSYKASYGRTIVEAVNHYRIKQAKRLLLDSERNIDGIAMECGFNSTTYFRRVFKAVEGMPPFRFRQLYTRVHVNTK